MAKSRWRKNLKKQRGNIKILYLITECHSHPWTLATVKWNNSSSSTLQSSVTSQRRLRGDTGRGPDALPQVLTLDFQWGSVWRAFFTGSFANCLFSTVMRSFQFYRGHPTDRTGVYCEMCSIKNACVRMPTPYMHLSRICLKTNTEYYNQTQCIENIAKQNSSLSVWVCEWDGFTGNLLSVRFWEG